jgi:hypothetical protein
LRSSELSCPEGFPRSPFARRGLEIPEQKVLRNESEEMPQVRVAAERKRCHARIQARKEPVPIDREVSSSDTERAAILEFDPGSPPDLEVANRDLKPVAEKGENVPGGGGAMEEQVIDLWSVRCCQIACNNAVHAVGNDFDSLRGGEGECTFS